MEDPFALKIKELSRLGDTTRILNSLNRDSDCPSFGAKRYQGSDRGSGPE
jgi:hypothetical protein